MVLVIKIMLACLCAGGVYYFSKLLISKVRARYIRVPVDTKEGAVSIVVEQGRQDCVLVVDDINHRLIKIPLPPGMCATSIGVSVRDSRGTLHMCVRDIGTFDMTDFDEGPDTSRFEGWMN